MTLIDLTVAFSSDYPVVVAAEAGAVVSPNLPGNR